MSIIVSQDSIEIDSSGWRPKAPKDQWVVTVQVVQRFDGDAASKKARKPEINLDIANTAEDTTHKDWTNTPLTPDSARRIAQMLNEAAELAEKS